MCAIHKGPEDPSKGLFINDVTLEGGGGLTEAQVFVENFQN